MQILEHGNKAPIITCDCGCKFIYFPTDVKETEEGKKVTCPECGKEHTVQ